MSFSKAWMSLRRDGMAHLARHPRSFCVPMQRVCSRRQRGSDRRWLACDGTKMTCREREIFAQFVGAAGKKLSGDDFFPDPYRAAMPWRKWPGVGCQSAAQPCVHKRTGAQIVRFFRCFSATRLGRAVA
ncbi:hypothetical protein, partial [Stenotrophomonas pictorum]|uniref:hypothetical protein n=1 Tax=Stenotrophomonas pictorum TaxID=86184 RepID=UPI001C46FECA